MTRHTHQQRQQVATAIAQFAEEIDALNRAPFRRMLADFLGVKPTRAALQKFANKSPDRWSQALSILAVLAGYERGVLQVNHYNVQDLSDAELYKQARMAGLTIDVTPEVGLLPAPTEISSPVPSSPEGTENGPVAEAGLELSTVDNKEPTQ